MRTFFRKLFFMQVWFRYRYRHHTISPLKLFLELKESQYWDKIQIRTKQLEQMRRLVNLAKSSNSFYKEKYNSLTTLDIESLNDVRKFGIITKNEIQQNDLRIAHNNKISFEAKTSGSTGDPLTVQIDDVAMAYRIAGKMRFYSWWNVSPYDRSVMIWGEKSEKSIDRSKHPLRKLYNKFIKRNININVFMLNLQTIETFFLAIVRYKPAYIYGYTSAIKQFAELVSAKGLDAKLLNLKVIIVTSEVLLEDDRSFIEKKLLCKVANEYGSADGGIFAFECQKGNMHVFEEAIYLYTNNNGEAISTELYNEVMPIINYKIGDRLQFDNIQCSCGRTLKIIEKIEGRIGDVIVRPDGSNLSQYFFYYLMKDIETKGFKEAIYRYKTIQKNNLFDFYIVKGNKFNEHVEGYILQRMHKEIGSEITVNFIYVKELPREPSGKLRFFKREQ